MDPYYVFEYFQAKKQAFAKMMPSTDHETPA
jgi:hypothetical protein